MAPPVSTAIEVRRAFAVAGIGAALYSPPLRAALEASMLVHMLVQLPLLAAIGFLCGRALRESVSRLSAAPVFRSFDAGGVTGILFASVVMVLWMLPRWLDGARMDAAVDALKFVSVAAAGAAVSLSWPRCPALVRGVVHLEVIATLLRFGWGYLAADARLCASYLLRDQQLTGTALLLGAMAYTVAVAWRPMFGTPRPAT
ncbi:MAG: hypothetical protein Q8L49_03135 [Burkholderiaceae bacterium]|nr:hypothetical protein [Burkholderiaceae bacterium]